MLIKSISKMDALRHSTAHLLAMATQELFPGVQVTIGPVIEDGFYYDFASGHTFSPEDLEKIERRMAEIVEDDLRVERLVMDREQAIKTFREMGEHYKVQIIEEFPEGEEISLYKQGPWMDLCRGPHVPSTGKLQAFKLTKVAGAYWRGDSSNEMLQRVYGTAWRNSHGPCVRWKSTAHAVCSMSACYPRFCRSGSPRGWPVFTKPTMISGCKRSIWFSLRKAQRKITRAGPQK